MKVFRKLGLVSVMASMVLSTSLNAQNNNGGGLGIQPNVISNGGLEIQPSVTSNSSKGFWESIFSTSDSSVTTTTLLNDTVTTIARELRETTIPNVKISNVAVTSFVDLNQLNKTTRFGRVIGESFIHELNKAGIRVMDIRGQKTLMINGSGEFFLSRNIKNLNNRVKNKYVLVGTYAKVAEGIVINSRIMDNIDGSVVATSRVVYRTNNCQIFESCEAPRKTTRYISLATDGCSIEPCPTNCVDAICSNIK